MIPWFGPHLAGTEGQWIERVLASGYINDGPLTREIEGKIAQFLGVKHAMMVTSGTAAITLALMGLGIGPGDEVIVPDLTFAATANAVRLAGASVRLVDIEPNRFGICPVRIMDVMNERTKAVIAVDVNGRGADYDSLRKICNDSGRFLVCDSTEGFGSVYNGRKLGTYGDAGCFSFSANKTISSGQGGCVVTDNEGLYYRLRELKDQGRRYDGSGGDDHHPTIGFNFKYTDLQAAVLSAQFEKIHDRLKAANARDAKYKELLAPTYGHLPENQEQVGEVTQWADILVSDRDGLIAKLTENQIGSRAFWRPLHTQAPYFAPDAEFPVSAEISASGLWLPSRYDMTDEDFERTCNVVLAMSPR